jgi:hypothetical protein
MNESDSSGGSDESKIDSNSKVATVIQQYNLSGLGDELVENWLLDTDGRMSLRELADHFNQELLTQVLRGASLNTLDGEPANFYRLLTDDSVSSGTSVQARNQLEQRGINIDQLLADFVSRQAIHTYLTKERDVSYSTSEDDPVEKEATNIQRLKRRMTTILESKIERLRNIDRITLGEFNLLIDIRVLCEDCGAQYQVTELLDRGACDCPQDSS